MTLQPSLLPRDSQNTPWEIDFPQVPFPCAFSGTNLPLVFRCGVSGNMFILPYSFVQIACCQFHRDLLFAQYPQTMCHWTDANATAQQFPEMTMPSYYSNDHLEFFPLFPGAYVDLNPLYPSYTGYASPEDDGCFAMPHPSSLDNQHMVSNGIHSIYYRQITHCCCQTTTSDFYERSPQLSANGPVYGQILSAIRCGHDTDPEELALSPVESADNNTMR